MGWLRPPRIALRPCCVASCFRLPGLLAWHLPTVQSQLLNIPWHHWILARILFPSSLVAAAAQTGSRATNMFQCGEFTETSHLIIPSDLRPRDHTVTEGKKQDPKKKGKERNTSMPPP
ncbi:hypothetical protein BO70DRAFT_8198 [Aspergillus heteromorphus CBS 117.55]|uniref:Uncharacterized protein n=1 Tax=Aspergillus heteromorphus CBS 117.55 TaxID=1448321 RepID=A0A317X1A7_9EURO|nr:uncharacterized protein BO70DRAFT_8198 [Aspergillus heteromorphus CBS 117.55]PWY92366.1 hypothetical protein BO70DRAFT_8198 [Aspergillus heteromorphus CBS 117.55]